MTEIFKSLLNKKIVSEYYNKMQTGYQTAKRVSVRIFVNNNGEIYS
jgi:hypothetical protein